jgi:hypothetical protein
MVVFIWLAKYYLSLAGNGCLSCFSLFSCRQCKCSIKQLWRFLKTYGPSHFVFLSNLDELFFRGARKRSTRLRISFFQLPSLSSPRLETTHPCTMWRLRQPLQMWISRCQNCRRRGLGARASWKSCIAFLGKERR